MFLKNKPIPEDKQGITLCSCGNPAKEMSPSVKGGRVSWVPRCGGCRGQTYGRKR